MVCPARALAPRGRVVARRLLGEVSLSPGRVSSEMISPSARAVLAPIALVAVALALVLVFAAESANGPWIMALVSVVALVLTSALTAQAAATNAEGLHVAARAARRGEPVQPPAGVSSEVARIYDELVLVSETQGAVVSLRDDVEGLRQRNTTLAAELERLTAELDRAQEHGRSLLDTGSDTAAKEAAHSLSVGLTALRKRLLQQKALGGEASTAAQEMIRALRDISEHTEVLMARAEDSSRAIHGMTQTTQQVAENMGELSQAVRESVASIEEMHFSIKEVAGNVDALASTAEDTAASMQEMDISIDQVQSNANETARLSEEVRRDAEHGAQSIAKTISEIFRIKESSQEAVSVISNLASQIDAIGRILSVIDEVAEQTNLLALNAAIIAAQAGEHGKGFAVVAEQIKDLAERSGASTKEIADLIKKIQKQSSLAIQAVERGAKNVDRGVEVSNAADSALQKILESSEKSTDMVRAIARATVEQAKGSRQVTDSISLINRTVQQIAAATAEQARGSQLIMSTGERMRRISIEVEASSQTQADGGQQVSQAIENIRALSQRIAELHTEKARQVQQLHELTVEMETAAGLEDALDKMGADLESVSVGVSRSSSGPG